MKIKRIFAFLLSLIMMLAIFSGCSTPAEDQDGSGDDASTNDDAQENNGDSETVTLTWQSYDSYDKYEAVINAFEEKYPNIKIDFEEVSDYTTKVLTEATSNALPDLLNCNTGITQVFAEAGVLQAFDTDALSADTEYNFADFWETASTYCTYDGTWYALPIDGGNYFWVYNVDMFEACDIDVPEDGFTWDEFEDVCATLMEHKDELGIEYATIFNDLTSSIDMMYPLITEAGGSYLNDDGTCGWNSDAAVSAFDWVNGLVDKGYIPSIEKLGDGYDALITKFNAGQIAMCRVALWNSLYLEDSDNVTWCAMNAPRGNDGTQAEVLFLNGIGISNSCAHYDEALAFIKFFTSEEGLSLYLQGCSSPQIAVRRAQADLSVAMFDESKNMEVVNSSLDYCGYVDLTNTFADQQTVIGQYFDEIWYNGADVQTTLDQMVEQLNTLLPQ
jgi:multiple sugar transport system substrate-binding protein